MVYASVFDSSQRKETQSLVYFAGEKIYPDFTGECSRRYMEICDQSALKLLSDTLKTVGMIFASNSILLIFLILAFIHNNEIELPIPVIFPFTDLESVNGLVINLLNQSFMAFMVVAGNIGIAIPTCMLNNSVWIVTVTICHAIDELTEILNGLASDSKTGIDYCFRNILIQVQDLDRYVETQNCTLNLI